MKNLIGFTGSFLLLCLVISCIILPALPQARAEEGSSYSESSRSSDEDISCPVTDDSSYLISEYEGRLAVFRKDEGEPEYISNTLVSDLPAKDQDRLKRGICVFSDRELKHMLQELCS